MALRAFTERDLAGNARWWAGFVRGVSIASAFWIGGGTAGLLAWHWLVTGQP